MTSVLPSLSETLARALAGISPSEEEALGTLAETSDLETLITASGALRDAGHGDRVSYSRKVFVPLTQLCRDSCHYCAFARPPKRGERAFLTLEEVLAIARAGAAAGCREVLFTLGDQPEGRYRAAREELASLGHETTLGYLAEAAELVLQETGLLPHLNPGLMSEEDLVRLRRVSVSQGIMLETASERLAHRGGPHFGSPDKIPAARIATLEAAGRTAVPFTSGILIGIGETRRERVEALLALRALHARHGHIQEVIIQNFRAKPGTRMAERPEPSFDEHLWTVAVARLLLGADANVQAPPNLSAGALGRLIEAGINDWGGVSPVTPDHVNPEAPWPAVTTLAEATAAAGKVLVQRLALYPSFVRDAERWLDPSLRRPVLEASDAEGLARADAWVTGVTDRADLLPRMPAPAIATPARRRLAGVLKRAAAGDDLSEEEVVTLFGVQGGDFTEVCAAADALRRKVSGDSIGYVVNRNINYTNVCSFACRFCAFSKGRFSERLRGRAYDLDLAEIRRRAAEAWARGATEVCLQGGIHPAYTGETYLSILRAIREEQPGLHVHAFSPLEVWQGAATLGQPIERFLASLHDGGLGSLPGTAAEILDDEVRALICPDKLYTDQWLSVVEAAHGVGLRTTATMMFGHLDRPVHWARHLLRLRRLQARTGGFSEFVPLPFVPVEAPLYLEGRARPGPTLREAVLVHAVARLALNPLFPNIQTSWVKMGEAGARLCLEAGANDLGGTLMNESISRAAGASHGQEMTSAEMEALISRIGRSPRQRTTLYGGVSPERRRAAFAAAPLVEPIYPSAGRRPRVELRGEPA